MAQTVPFDAYLGAGKTGLAIGATIYQLNGSTVATAFATTGFYEAPAGSGHWHHAGLSLPDAGGVIAVGISGTEYQRVAVGPASNSLSSEQVQSAVEEALNAYDPPTKAELDAAQVSIESTIADEIAALGASVTVTVISAVDGNSITLYQNDTWRFTMTLAGVTLTTYEALVFAVKESEHQSDSASNLLLRSDTGLQRIGGAAAASSGNGALTVDSATALTIVVSISETVNASVGDLTWWLKGFDSTPAPDEGFTLATGFFSVRAPGISATS